MMTNKVLLGVLLVQTGLAAVTWWPRGGDAAAEAAPLVALDASAITGIEITGRAADGEVPEPVKLVKQGDTWTIESLDGYPADPTKVTDLLDDLLGLKVRAPVATQATSHAALEVADDAFTRKVKLTAGSDTVEVILGAASGQAVNARRAGEPEVYAARGFTAWSVGDAARRYLDTSYVDVDAAKVSSLTIENASGTVTLEKAGEDWTSPALAEGQELNPDEIDRLVGKLLKVRLDEPVGKEREPAFGLDGGARVRWTLTDGETSTTGGYVVGAVADGKRYVQAEGNPFVVKVYASGVEPALETTLSDLLEAPDPFAE